jgi:hypothetical protein
MTFKARLLLLASFLWGQAQVIPACDPELFTKALRGVVHTQADHTAWKEIVLATAGVFTRTETFAFEFGVDVGAALPDPAKNHFTRVQFVEMAIAEALRTGKETELLAFIKKRRPGRADIIAKIEMLTSRADEFRGNLSKFENSFSPESTEIPQDLLKLFLSGFTRPSDLEQMCQYTFSVDLADIAPSNVPIGPQAAALLNFAKRSPGLQTALLERIKKERPGRADIYRGVEAFFQQSP